jgi:hypothetical protein
MSKGEYADEPVAMHGHREVVLVSTDDTPSWGPGHADWKCLACGRRHRPRRTCRREDCTS